MLNLVDTSLVLQFHIELALDGMMLNPDAPQSMQNGALTARTMMELVKERRNALRHPEPQLQRVLDCPHTGRYPFEVCSLLHHNISRLIAVSRFVTESGDEPTVRWETTITRSNTISYGLLSPRITVTLMSINWMCLSTISSSGWPVIYKFYWKKGTKGERCILPIKCGHWLTFSGQFVW
jgi:hypothetical protein